MQCQCCAFSSVSNACQVSMLVQCAFALSIRGAFALSIHGPTSRRGLFKLNWVKHSQGRLCKVEFTNFNTNEAPSDESIQRPLRLPFDRSSFCDRVSLKHRRSKKRTEQKEKSLDHMIVTVHMLYIDRPTSSDILTK